MVRRTGQGLLAEELNVLDTPDEAAPYTFGRTSNGAERIAELGRSDA